MSTATQSLRPLMDRLRRGWRASPMPGFFRWWGGELRGLLPLRWRGWFSDGADWHLLQYDGMQWTLRRSGHAELLASWDDSLDAVTGDVRNPPAALDTALRSVDREDRRLALLLPPAVVLRRTLALPLAARDNLQQVVAFEMDRQTPFSVAQVYYAVRELSAPAGAGRFSAELLAVMRDTLDPLLTRLHAQGISIDAVDLAVADDRLGVNLLPPEQIPHRARPRRTLNLALAAGCVLLLLLLLSTWLNNREQTLAQMQAQVDTMRGEAQQVAALRQQLQDDAGAAGFLVQRKERSVAVLSLLLEVTKRLPESAWLERFSLDNTGQVGFQGQSVQAAKLLDLLKDSPLITDVNFQGSIQADPITGKERFFMVAQLRKPAVNTASKPAPAPASSGGAP
ncbi:MAG TPA: PilN domain-containing protein [Rhodanobacter sp.]|nr:PilN domain-containing protein [Rhodanobacter sp.]